MQEKSSWIKKNTLSTRSLMKICKKCGEKFPNALTIEGKRRNFSHRIYCLKCSPWGYHNTKRIHGTSTTDGFRVCPRCQKTKPISEYYKRRNIEGTSSYCKPCSINQSLERQREFKNKCLIFKGGKCEHCGYNKFHGALEFHHIDPELKDFEIGRSKLWKFDDKIKNEINKCLLLCKNCHAEEHGRIDKMASQERLELPT